MRTILIALALLFVSATNVPAQRPNQELFSNEDSLTVIAEYLRGDSEPIISLLTAQRDLLLELAALDFVSVRLMQSEDGILKNLGVEIEREEFEEYSYFRQRFRQYASQNAYWLGLISTSRLRFAEALTHYEQAAALHPDHRAYVRVLSRIRRL